MAQSFDEEKGAPRVLTGNYNPDKYLLSALKVSLEKAASMDICVSFVMESGISMLTEMLEKLVDRGVKVRVLCSTYLQISQPSALLLLRESLKGKGQVRLYNQEGQSFHPKAYLFRNDTGAEMYIGSSNLSRSALTSGVEWSYRIDSSRDAEAIEEFAAEFEHLFAQGIDLTDEVLQEYQKSWRQPAVYKDIEALEKNTVPREKEEQIEPRGAQIAALHALKSMREQGSKRALVQAATGIGKTYLAAFDARYFKRVLFVAHRQEILEQACASFKRVMPERSAGFFQGSRQEADADMVFASVFTLGQERYLHPDVVAPAAFDYIVFDECHHLAAHSYQKILDYFKPHFVLGLTATPYRMDGQDIYKLLDYNVAFELDLFQAINQGMLAPFRYYGIYDDTDYTKVPFRKGKYDPAVLSRIYRENEARTSLIVRHVKKHGPAKILAFCADTSHADYMSDVFNAASIPSAPVHSSSKYNRQQAIEDLQSGKLQALFTVDMFNEGVDIPSVDMVLFLRPTQSPAVFLQQLGRGLRKDPGKEYLTVLDFIGNYKTAGKIPDWLGLDTTRNRIVNNGLSAALPRDCFLDFDLTLIDLFEKMRANQAPAKEKIWQEAARIKEQVGHTPTRMELYEEMDEDIYNLAISHSNLNLFKHWFSYFAERGEDIPQFDTYARSFLEYLETTSMSKVYKMPVLLAFWNGNQLLPKVGKERLLEVWKDFFAKNMNWKDLGVKTFQEFEGISDKKHLKNIYSNPVKFLVKSSNGLFTLNVNEELELDLQLARWLQDPEFIRQYLDILHFRAADYYRRRYLNAARG